VIPCTGLDWGHKGHYGGSDHPHPSLGSWSSHSGRAPFPVDEAFIWSVHWWS